MKQKNVYGDKPRPFEKVLGDTPELRILNELLPLAGRMTVDNDETYLTFEEISENTGLESQEFFVAITWFRQFEMILTRHKNENEEVHEYALNKNSPVVQSIAHFDNALINVMLKNFQGNPT